MTDSPTANSETNSTNKLFTVAELAKDFQVQIPTIRRYINFFEIPHTKEGRKTILPKESSEFIAQIIKFKENGLNLKQIKDLVTSSTTQQAPISSEDLTKNTIATSETKPKPSIQEAVQPKQSREPKKAQQKQDKHINKQTSINSKTESSKPQTKESEVQEQAGQAVDTASQPTKTVQQQQQNSANTKPQNNQQTPATVENNAPAVKTNELNSTNLMTRDNISKAIQVQTRHIARIDRLLNTKKHLPREQAEFNSYLNKRYELIAGLRNLRDNWLEKGKEISNVAEDAIVQDLLTTVNNE